MCTQSEIEWFQIAVVVAVEPVGGGVTLSLIYDLTSIGETVRPHKRLNNNNENKFLCVAEMPLAFGCFGKLYACLMLCVRCIRFAHVICLFVAGHFTWPFRIVAVGRKWYVWRFWQLNRVYNTHCIRNYLWGCDLNMKIGFDSTRLSNNFIHFHINVSSGDVRCAQLTTHTHTQIYYNHQTTNEILSAVPMSRRAGDITWCFCFLSPLPDVVAFCQTRLNV